jgi:hypothetical protein
MLSENFYFLITIISIYQVTHECFTKFGIIRSQEQPNLEPVKTFISQGKCKFESQSRIATPVQTHLFELWIVAMLSNRCPNLLSRSSVYVQILNLNSHSLAGSLCVNL